MNEQLMNSSSYSDIGNEYPSISVARLRALETKQGYITYDDILRLFPEAEQNVDFLDQIYTAIRTAGIPFSEDDFPSDALNESSADEEEYEIYSSRSLPKEENSMSNIDPDNLVGLYIYDAARYPLLTHEEEVNLAKRIERGLLAREEISDIKNMPFKRYEELKFLIDDGWNAVDHLITANSRLVISIAKKYMHRGVPFLDLIQEGNIGLMRAVKRFDYKRGYKFSTYATWWIRQAVTRFLANQGRIIRLPVHRNNLFYKMLRVQHFLEQKLGREPDAVEIAEMMGSTSEKIQQIIDDAKYTLSLDMPTSFEDDSVLGDNIEDLDAPDFDDVVSLSLLHQLLEQIFVTLPPREVQILKLRYGLTNGKTHTLHEVGLKMGVSRERIRQIEAQAIRHLRHPEIQTKLRSYLNQLPA